jgi:hypothetical protein
VSLGAAVEVSLITIFAPFIEWMQGGDNPDTVTAWSNLAKSHLAAGRPKKAIPLLERTVAGCERLLARTTGTP